MIFRYKSTYKHLTPKLLRLQQSRPLTLGEKSLVYSIFYDQLDLDLPRIYASGWVIRGYAISPNGHVYFVYKENGIFNGQEYTQAFRHYIGRETWQSPTVNRSFCEKEKGLFEKKETNFYSTYSCDNGQLTEIYGVQLKKKSGELVSFLPYLFESAPYFIRKGYDETCDFL